MAAHKAGCAAGKQQKFVQYKNAFWDKAFGPYASGHDASKLGVDNIMAIAKDIGLDTTKLKADMESPDCQAQVEGDMQELAKFHVNSTPTFFINGKHFPGALSKEQFKQVIDEKLKVAEAYGPNAFSQKAFLNGTNFCCLAAAQPALWAAVTSCG